MTMTPPSKALKLKIEFADPDTCIDYPKNNKLHSSDQVKRLAAVIEKNGFDQPIVLDLDRVIIKGHGRKLAAKSLGMKLVPIIVRHDLTKEEADAARIADNITTSTAYDTRAMQEELNRLLIEGDFGLTAENMGLTQKEQDLLLGDIESPNLDALMHDAEADLAEAKEQDAERVAAADHTEVRVADALGFKVVTGEEARVISHYIARAEGETGKTGKEALISALQQALAA